MPPTGEPDELAVQEGGTVSVEATELLANDSDAEGDALSVTAVGDAANGLVALDGGNDHLHATMAPRRTRGELHLHRLR